MEVDGPLGAVGEGGGTALGARIAAHGATSTALALHSDRALRELLDAATPLGSGIGGTSSVVEVDGTPVFVKRVPLTDLERESGHVRSTANLFGLPVFCQYGIGSPGFGAWRELATHAMTTNWVLTGACASFPLTHHWRVVPDSAPPPDALADVERTVAYWGGGPQVRHRVEALRQASASIALFLEYVPQNLSTWLGRQSAAGGDTADRAYAMVERELEAVTAFMSSQGLLHFDAHFENVLTDGHRLYVADYGLALSSRFELAPDETDFFDRHRTFDRCYTRAHLVNRLVADLYGLGRDGRDARVRAYARGERPTGIPAGAAAILTRHAPLAAVMSRFFREVQNESRQAPYPLEEIRRTVGGHGPLPG